MKRLASLLFAAVALCFSAPSLAQGAWGNQSAVMQNVDGLLLKVELLDEALHAASATDETIMVLHHFEETVQAAKDEFVGYTFAQARQELDHLREDIFLVYNKLESQQFLNAVPVIEAWNVALESYIRLERSLDCP